MNKLFEDQMKAGLMAVMVSQLAIIRVFLSTNPEDETEALLDQLGTAIETIEKARRFMSREGT